MRLKELNDDIAAACNVRASVVTAVQNETFRQIRAALARGEKIVLPDFGTLVVKEAAPVQPGGEPRKFIRFREQNPRETANAIKRRDAEAERKSRVEAVSGEIEED